MKKRSKKKYYSDWKKFGTTLSPEAMEVLRKKKEEGYKLNLVINRAIMGLEND